MHDVVLVVAKDLEVFELLGFYFSDEEDAPVASFDWRVGVEFMDVSLNIDSKLLENNLQESTNSLVLGEQFNFVNNVLLGEERSLLEVLCSQNEWAVRRNSHVEETVPDSEAHALLVVEDLHTSLLADILVFGLVFFNVNDTFEDKKNLLNPDVKEFFSV